MQIEQIALEKLLAHPANANVMSEERQAKLADHIGTTGQYAPLVVRVHPQRRGCYELLNGHHRKKSLAKLGHAWANCVVWEVSDEQALLLLATLNRLSGADDPHARAALVAKLLQRYDREKLLAKLPEQRKQLEKLLNLTKRPTVAPPKPLRDWPEPMTFFLTADQKTDVEAALRQVRREAFTPHQRPTRGDLLTSLVRQRSLSP